MHELSSNSTEPPQAGSERARLQELLKRCSPATRHAAWEFSRTSDVRHVSTLVIGVIERYVERELRPKLQNDADHLRLVEDLGIDSLTMMEIVCLAEDVLRINVGNEELVRLKTVGDVTQFVTSKVSSA